MPNTQILRKFLVTTEQATFASGDLAQKITNKDNSTTLTFQDNDWKYHDNYFGGEPYGGREVVFFKNSPIYMMVYYDRVNNSAQDINKIYQVLINALKLIPKDYPYRGPNRYRQSGFYIKMILLEKLTTSLVKR